MATSDARHDSDPVADDDHRRRPRGGGVMRTMGWIFTILILLAIGLGAFLGKKRYDAFVSGAEEQRAKISDLDTQLARLNEERAASDKLAASAQSDLNASRSELEELRLQRAEAEKRAEAFRTLTEKFQKMIDTGKLKVLMRRGRMIVKMPSEVLFPSASAELSVTGKQTLVEVAAILNKQDANRHLMVAGHTDNLPIADEKFKNNWALSTARAVAVTEFLLGRGMKPKNLVAAGYAENDPVADNRTPAGQQENRRIEIELLPPTLDEIVQIDPKTGAVAAAPKAAPAPAGSTTPASTAAPKP